MFIDDQQPSSGNISVFLITKYTINSVLYITSRYYFMSWYISLYRYIMAALVHVEKNTCQKKLVAKCGAFPSGLPRATSSCWSRCCLSVKDSLLSAYALTSRPAGTTLSSWLILYTVASGRSKEWCHVTDVIEYLWETTKADS